MQSVDVARPIGETYAESKENILEGLREFLDDGCSFTEFFSKDLVKYLEDIDIEFTIEQKDDDMKQFMMHEMTEPKRTATFLSSTQPKEGEEIPCNIKQEITSKLAFWFQ